MYASRHEQSIHLSPILVWIIFFAVLWFILWLTHHLGIKRKGFSLTKQNLPVVQKREMQLDIEAFPNLYSIEAKY